MKQQYRYTCAGILLFFLFLFEIIIDTLATAPCILDCIETYTTGTYWEKKKQTQVFFYWQFLITYIFSVSLKFEACYIMGKLDKFRVNNVTLCLYIHFWHFLFFFNEKFIFYHFHFFFSFFFPFLSFFYEASSFRSRRLTHQKLDWW